MIRKIPFTWECGEKCRCIQFLFLEVCDNGRIVNTVWRGKALINSAKNPKKLLDRIQEFRLTARKLHIDISHIVTKEGELVESSI